MAKDILHLTLPDSKAVSMSFECTHLHAIKLAIPATFMAHRLLACAAVHSQSQAVPAVAECVWAHYLTVTGKGAELSLSPAQQQEVWVQYTALQIALQVSNSAALFSISMLFFKVCLRLSSHLFFFFYPNIFPQAYQQSLKKFPSDASIIGLSHTRLFLTSFSQVWWFYCLWEFSARRGLKQGHTWNAVKYNV